MLEAQSTEENYIRAEGGFHKERYIYVVERTNKAEMRPGVQSETAESRREKLWNDIQLKGPSRRKQAPEQNRKEWASSVGLCLGHKS